MSVAQGLLGAVGVALLIFPAGAAAQCRPDREACQSLEYAQTDCGISAIAQARAGRGACLAHCADAVESLTAATCSDRAWLDSVCGQLELAAWGADVLALESLRQDGDPQALLPGEQIASTCFALTQDRGDLVLDAREVLVPGCADLDLEPGEMMPLCDPLAGAGESTIASVVPYERQGQTMEGFATHYYGLRTRHWTLASRSGGPAAISPDALADARRQAWDDNGTVVESCAEYVYEKYYDYSLFEDAVAAAGHDYRATFQIAYLGAPPPPERVGPGGRDRAAAIRQTGGLRQRIDPRAIAAGARAGDVVRRLIPPRSAIGARGMYGFELRAKDNTPLPTQVTLPSTPQRRNVFFSVPVGFATPAGNEGLPAAWQFGSCNVNLVGAYVTICDPELADLLNQRYADPGANVVKDWAWHKRTSDALKGAGYLDEALAGFDQRKERFGQLLARRGRLVRELVDFWRRPIQDLPGVVAAALPDLDAYVNPPPFDAVTQTLERQRAKRSAIGAATPSFFMPAELAGLNVGFNAIRPDLAALTRSFRGVVGFEAPANAIPYSDRGGQENAPLLDTSFDLGGQGQVARRVERPYQGAPLQSMLRQLATLDGAIEAQLRDALDSGCLAVDEANPCDWSPKQFAQEVLDRYTAEREVDYRLCQEATEGDVQALSGHSWQISLDGVYHYPTTTAHEAGTYPNPTVACFLTAEGELLPIDGLEPGFAVESVQYTLEGGLFDNPDTIPGVNEWNRSTSHFDQYLRCRAPYAKLFLNSIARDLGDSDIVSTVGDRVTVHLVDQEADRFDQGSDDVGLSAEYGFGWAIGRFEEYLGCQEPDCDRDVAGCNLSPEMYGYLDIEGRLLADYALLDASVHVKVGDEQESEFAGLPGTVRRDRLSADVILLGQLVDEDLDLGNPEWNIVADDYEYSRVYFQAGATFTIVFIPVSVRGGVAGKIGFRYSVDAEVPLNPQEGQCDLARLTGTFEPYLQVDGFATAAVDLLIVAAGVKISLTIIGISLPFTTYLKLGFNGGAITLGAGLSLDLAIGFLAGSFALYVEAFWETYEFPVFRWDGLRFQTNLFNVDTEVDLVQVADAVRLARGR